MENERRQRDILVLGGIVLVIIICLGVFIHNALKPKEYGGPITDTSWSLGNVQKIIDAGFSDMRFSDLNESLRQSTLILNPGCSEMRVIKNAKKKKDNNYAATLEICGENYKISLVDNEDQFSYTISKGGDELLSYDSSSIDRVYPAKERIDALLPHTLTMDDGTIVTLKHYTDDYEIAVLSCGNADIKKRAEQAVRDWITEVGFNQEEYTFKIPNYCDGE